MRASIAGGGAGGARGARGEAAPRGVLVPSLATAVALAVLIGLGIWQLDRKEWKEALITALAERLAAPPVALPPSRDWPYLAPADEFMRVTMTAAFENDKEGLVFTGGSTLRDDGTGPGYWVFTPARLTDGNIIMVNRGFVPEDRQNPANRPDGQITGPVAMIGVLRFAEPPGLFTPSADPARNIWFSRDPGAIAQVKGISVAPFYVELESPEPPGGLPHPARLHPNLPDNHLQYAITWFGLAAVFAGAYVAWLFGGWRKREVLIGR
jgi:surfeit locus 1 family protein